MPKPIDVLLCEREAVGGRQQLRAVLDELTLTYTIVVRGPGGPRRELRRHVPSLRDARRWAQLHADRQDPTADRAA
jgi:hypothetical protein